MYNIESERRHIDSLAATLTSMRKEMTVFVPGTKNQPEARVETMIAGITFICQLGPTDWAPKHVFRFAKPIPYQFVEEEGQKPSNWLPPVFKKVRRGKIESRFVRLEYVDDNKTSTQLVFYYHSGAHLDQQELQFTQYVQGTLWYLQEQCDSISESNEWTPITLETVTLTL